MAKRAVFSGSTTCEISKLPTALIKVAISSMAIELCSFIRLAISWVAMVTASSKVMADAIVAVISLVFTMGFAIPMFFYHF